MANIVLIETGSSHVEPNPVNRGNTPPPFALENLAGYLIDRDKNHQHKVRIICEEQLKKVEIPDYEGEDIKITPEMITEMLGKMGEPIIVGIRAVSPLYPDALELTRTIKSVYPEAKVIIGGYHATGAVEMNQTTLIYKSETYNDFERELQAQYPDAQLVDCFAYGEGEETLQELVEKYTNPENMGKTNAEILSGIKSAVYRDIKTGNEYVNERRERLGEVTGGQRVFNPPDLYRKITIPICDKDGKVADLREIPSSIGRFQTGTEIPHYNVREIQSNYTRGCPHQCPFCASTCVWDKYITFRDPKKVVEEAAKLNVDPEYRLNYIYFADLTFNMASEPLLNLAARMQNVRIREKGSTYYDKDNQIYYLDELTQDEIDAGMDNGRKVFGHDNEDQVHWFGLAQVFKFIKGGKKIEAAGFKSSFLTELAEPGSNEPTGFQKLVWRENDLWEAFSSEFWAELGYTGEKAQADFRNEISVNPGHLYDNLEVLSDKFKHIDSANLDPELKQILDANPGQEKFTASLFEYLGFPPRVLVDPREVIREMRKAGCSKLGIGIEGVTRRDIVEQKGLDVQTRGGAFEAPVSKQALKDRGTERFTQAALTFHTMKEEGMFTRGYFIWGSEQQNKYALDRAKLMFGLELPDKIFNDYDALFKVTDHLLDEVDKYYPEERLGVPAEEYQLSFEEVKVKVQQEINHFILEKFKEGDLVMTTEDLSDDKRNRFLDIDHLRLGYETPYLGTDTAKNDKRTLRCAEAYKDGHKVLLLGGDGKLIFKRTIESNGQIIQLDCKLEDDKGNLYSIDSETGRFMAKIDGGKRHYYYPQNATIPEDKWGQEVEKDVLADADYVENMEVKGKTLHQLISSGWDDLRYLYQETPILDCDVPLKQLMTDPDKLIREFHGCAEYRRSVEHRLRDNPEQKEACYAWDLFWQEAKNITFLDDQVKAEVIENIIDEAKGLDLDEEHLSYWLKERINSKYNAKIDEIVRSVKAEQNGEITSDLKPAEENKLEDGELPVVGEHLREGH